MKRRTRVSSPESEMTSVKVYNILANLQGKIVSLSSKITSRFYKLVINIETCHKKEDIINSLINEQFYFKSKELFKARVSILNPYNLSDKSKWCSSQILYSALIIEDPDNDMQGLVNFRLRDLRTMEVMKVWRIGGINSLEMRLPKSNWYCAQLLHECAPRKLDSRILRGKLPLGVGERNPRKKGRDSYRNRSNTNL